MKLICPNCADRRVKPVGKLLHCPRCGRDFTTGQSLLSLSDAIELGKALTHKTRLAILLAFRGKEELSPKEIAESTGDSIAHICYHVDVLLEMDPPLLLPTKERKVRGATEHFYRLNTHIL